ncbi:uncharacterized protein SPPG_00278 [Spizellomyces punctatus DAOM BR117]|uniref:MACPF domain-containing protein n=1 Tax=Spizellomyces punctatus (strain DAOM BR117) TaxID=645134 RepID=A0A0L0HTX1_SPIPD|nr:uncharacterized protein SPPG_00278 [Spizellomyces punctatus DAOM BR117]KND04553.1 hypothetical protein SPPG_00278 [Spizellomyces punctatus DAOM BR117]|eukprot:XP_016612592.1 hypothetical protein SPPG_00278 [Spizellomyces punctatus DAOM BR117]
MTGQSDPTKRPRIPIKLPDDDPLTILPGSDFVGCGYNVLRGFYADATSCGARLFQLDKDGFEQVEIARGYLFSKPKLITEHPAIGTQFWTASGTSIKEFVSQVNSRTKIEGEYNFFSGSIESDFGQSTAENSQMSFSKVQYNVDLYTLQLPPSSTASKLVDPKVQTDIDNMDPFQLFNTYGTHYVASLVMGGRAVYTSSTNKFDFSSKFSLDIVAKASYKALTGSISAEEELKFRNDIRSFNENSTTHLRTTGGSPGLGGDSFPEHANDWAKSVIDYIAFVDFLDFNSLQPIWGLASTPARSDALHKAFAEYCEKYQEHYVVDSGPYLRAKVVPLSYIQYTDRGSGSRSDLSVCQADIGGGWYSLGQIAFPNYNTPSGRTVVVQEIVPNSGALADVASWQRVWDDHGSGKSGNYNLWRGLASNPVDYAVLGDFFRGDVGDQNPPSAAEANGIKAVNIKCLTPAQIGSKVWDDTGTHASDDGSVWNIIPREQTIAALDPSISPYFASAKNHSPPQRDVYVLKKSAVVFVQDVASRDFSSNLTYSHDELPDEGQDITTPLKFGSLPNDIDKNLLPDSILKRDKLHHATSPAFEVHTTNDFQKVENRCGFARLYANGGDNILTLVQYRADTKKYEDVVTWFGGMADTMHALVQSGLRQRDRFEFRLVLVMGVCVIWLKNLVNKDKDYFVSLSHVFPYRSTQLVGRTDMAKALTTFLDIVSSQPPGLKPNPDHPYQPGTPEVSYGTYSINNFNMTEGQERTQWCWAVVCQSIARALGLAAYTQQEIVTAVFGKLDNKPKVIDVALEKVYNLKYVAANPDRAATQADVFARGQPFAQTLEMVQGTRTWYHAVITSTMVYQARNSVLTVWDSADVVPTAQDITWDNFSRPGGYRMIGCYNGVFVPKR